ncbi:MAG: DUF3857 domain-containing protein [Bacteroidetes bacterium]|nr:DUF3857 domain-containing protein [Bacteroidota bacterium]
MHTIKLLPLLLLFPLLTGAQKRLPDQDPVTTAELKMTACPFEPDAAAMILFDVQETEMEGTFMYTRNKTSRRVRIKVFSEKGYPHATVRIPYLSKRGLGKIKKLQGAVYNLDASGKIVVTSLSDDDFFKESANEYVGVMNFTFPKLKPGSIVEYSYTTIENNIPFLQPWFIQGKIPVQFIANTLITPVMMHVNARTYAFDSLSQQYYLFKQDRYRSTTFYKENIPSFRYEPYMSSLTDYLMWVSFATLGGGALVDYTTKRSSAEAWAIMGKYYFKSDNVQKLMVDSIKGTRPLLEAASKLTTTEDKIRFLFDTVKKHFAADPEQTMQADLLDIAWKKKEGTSAAINFTLLNLLDKSGVQCYPLLISTRTHGKIKKEYPGLGQMNGMDVLAFDSTRSFVLDASNKRQPYHTPPLNVLNRDGLLLSPDTAQWVAIADTRPLLKQSIDIYADVTKDGKLEGSATIQHFDYSKSYKMDSSLQKDSDEAEKYMDKKPDGFKIISTKLESGETDADPLTETIDFLYEPQQSGKFLFIDPQILTEKNKNPFLEEKRFTDIDLVANQLNILTMQVHFPPDYEVDHLPQNMMIRAPDSSFFYKVSYSSDKEAVYISQQFEAKRALFNKEEYPGIQDFYKRMFARMTEEIVLRKKE